VLRWQDGGVAQNRGFAYNRNLSSGSGSKLYGTGVPFVKLTLGRSLAFFPMSADTALKGSHMAPDQLEGGLRADARRNRKLILDAARRCFAEQGLEAQIDEIADKAGVGVGTVYRHFPTKRALAEALAADHFQRLAENARAALEEDDSWEGFRAFMHRSAEVQANDRALAEVMAAQPDVMREAATGREDLHEAVAELVARAQRAGKLRPDVVPDDVPMLMCGLGRATRVGSKGPTMSWQRYLAIVLDGLRAPGSSELPCSPR
jgi:AcrR family transcriptional regulator